MWRRALVMAGVTATGIGAVEYRGFVAGALAASDGTVHKVEGLGLREVRDDGVRLVAVVDADDPLVPSAQLSIAVHGHLAGRLEVGLEVLGALGLAEHLVAVDGLQHPHRAHAVRPPPGGVGGVVLGHQPPVAERRDRGRRPHRAPVVEPQVADALDLRSHGRPSVASWGVSCLDAPLGSSSRLCTVDARQPSVPAGRPCPPALRPG